MTRALELARSSLGKVSPNPSVGAVLVKDGRIVGEGATQPPGGPHAEVMAINSAGDLAAGATLYVSLEPCAHYGKTPPCAKALTAAGIHSAFVATIDPDPRTNGKGIELLKSEGIEFYDSKEEMVTNNQKFPEHQLEEKMVVLPSKHQRLTLERSYYIELQVLFQMLHC